MQQGAQQNPIVNNFVEIAMTTNGTIVVFGFGVVGRATTQALLARGATVRVAQRSRPADLPVQAAFVACDVLNAEAVQRAIATSAG